MKIVLFLLLIFSYVSVYADENNVSFNLSTYQEFEENDWEVYLSPINIDLWGYDTKNINLSISTNDYFIFSDDLSWVLLDSSSFYIDKVYLDTENKVLRINLLDDAPTKFTISWIKIRIYEETLYSAKIWLDYNNDDIVDLYSTNMIDVVKNDDKSDNMRPLAVTNVKFNLLEKSDSLYDAEFTWSWSYDLDSIWTLIRVKKNDNYWYIKEDFISKTEIQEYKYKNMDLEKDTYTFEIYSKDNYFLNTNPSIIILNNDSLLDINKDENNNKDDWQVCIQVLSYAMDPETWICEIFSTPCDIPDNYEEVDPCEEEWNIVIIEPEKTERYDWIFSSKNKKILDRVVYIIDQFIENKLSFWYSIEFENSIIEIRNDIVKELEVYDILKLKTEKKNSIEKLYNLIIKLRDSF